MDNLADVLIYVVVAGGVLLVPVAIIWIYQFVQLMLFSDSDFPGKYDKVLWVVAFFVAFPVAPLAFYSWKAAYQEMRSHERMSLEGEPKPS